MAGIMAGRDCRRDRYKQSLPVRPHPGMVRTFYHESYAIGGDARLRRGPLEFRLDVADLGGHGHEGALELRQ